MDYLSLSRLLLPLPRYSLSVVLSPLQTAKTLLLDRIQIQAMIRVRFQIGRGSIASVCEQAGNGAGVFPCTDLQSNMAYDSKKG